MDFQLFSWRFLTYGLLKNRVYPNSQKGSNSPPAFLLIYSYHEFDWRVTSTGSIKSPMENPSLQGGIAKPNASLAFSQLHKCMEERLEILEPDAISQSGFSSDFLPESTKKGSEKHKNMPTQLSMETPLQQEAILNFNAVLVELLATVPQDSTPKLLLRPVEFSNLPSIISAKTELQKCYINIQGAVVRSNQENINNSEPKKDPDPADQYAEYEDTTRVNYLAVTSGSCVIACARLEDTNGPDTKQELESSSQSDLIYLKDSLTDSQRTGRYYLMDEEREESDPHTLDLPAARLHRNQLITCFISDEERNKYDETSEGNIFLKGLIRNKETDRNPVKEKEPDLSNDTECEVMDGINNDKITRNELVDLEMKPPKIITDISDVHDLSDHANVLQNDLNIGQLTDARDKPDTPGEIYHLEVDGLDNLTGSQEMTTYNSGRGGKFPSRSDHGLCGDMLANIYDLQTIRNSAPDERLQPDDDLRLENGADNFIRSQRTEDNSGILGKESDTIDHRLRFDLSENAISSQKIMDNDPQEEELGTSAEGVVNGVLDDLKQRSQQTSKIMKSREKSDQSTGTVIEVLNDLKNHLPSKTTQAREKSATTLYTQEPDLAELMNGFNIREKILKWESKAKSMLISDNEDGHRSSNSPPVSKELRYGNVTRKKSQFETSLQTKANISRRSPYRM
ncbi:hypothetical protein R1flu_001640 [Riccia fluitans]|uniref:Uncharacterized protein n=1 Tax=Riccia fluitans TaxID=41844 RepID=A0ABD1Y3U8_9MARC